MDGERRDLILRVADGVPKAFPYLHQLDTLVHAKKFYRFLIASGITGHTFVEYYEKKFKLSFKAFTEWMIQAIEKNRDKRPAFFGRDVMWHPPKN